ncbi:MAG: hypothetical protein L3J14_05130 [Flavobacteriaceae bacterium]|nr:hypothetical protein [Flavobacteriaceae bacterium]
MRKRSVLFIGITALLMSCNQTKTDLTSDKEDITKATNLQDIDAYTLMKNNCYVCHNPKAVSHDSLLAPPFVAVKRRYSMQYTNKEEFVDAVINWATNPSKEKALMRGAVNQFNVMPPLPLDKEILKDIATYIYENEVEKPEWFDTHFNEMHPKGMGKGKGKGMKNN